MLNKLEPKMRVLSKIYEYCEVKKEPLWWSKLLQILESEELTRHEIFKATEELEVVFKVIQMRYKTVDKTWTCCYEINEDMKQMAKSIYEQEAGLAKKTSEQAFREFYDKLVFIYPTGTADSDLPECDNRVLCMGSNVCLGNEPYSCERMFKDYKCPRGYQKKREDNAQNMSKL
jgi:hypothetical protein